MVAFRHAFVSLWNAVISPLPWRVPERTKMLFTFYKYLDPTWYFHLLPKGDTPYFVDWDRMDERARSLVDFDHGYSGPEVAKLDAAWQAWHRGLIESDPHKKLSMRGIRPSLEDEYRFVRKYFHPVWSWYVLGLRLLSGHNPVREVRAFRAQRRMRRVNLYGRVFPHEQRWRTFDSALLRRQPMVTVVIPTLNRYPYLKDVLHDLEKQTYSRFEVIVVDQSEPFRPEFYGNFRLSLRLIRQEEKALWLARNTAIEQARGDLILLTEDDVRVQPDWVENHIRCLDFFNADISSGVFYPKGAGLPSSKAFFRWSDQFATGNACLRKRVFEAVGLFDRQFEKQRMGDGEFGLRAYLHGFKAVLNPYSSCIDVKAGTGGLRQMGSWDGFRPKSWLAPRPVPSVLYLCRKYFGNRAAVYLLLKGVPPSLIPYRYKRRPLMLLLGIPLTILLWPLVAWQVGRAWRIASRMLRQGAKIPRMNSAIISSKLMNP